MNVNRNAVVRTVELATLRLAIAFAKMVGRDWYVQTGARLDSGELIVLSYAIATMARLAIILTDLANASLDSLVTDV